MQPLVLHMPDALRDRLESDLVAAMPDMPDKIEYADYDRIKKVVEKHLFDLGQDHKSTEFLKQFYQAYLAMHTGAGNPVVLLENLPPTRGRLVMYGLGRLEGQISFGEEKDLTNKDDGATSPHRDTYHYSHILKNKKLGQYLYCKDAGNNPQPTVFITADDIIDHMAHQDKSKNFEAARLHIIDTLKKTIIHVSGNDKTESSDIPFLTCNPSYDPQYPNAAPEFLAFTVNRGLGDAEKITQPESKLTYLSFVKAAGELAEIETPHSIASTQSHSLAMWNDLLTFHMRGKTKDGHDESDRKVEVFETYVTHASGAEHIAVAGPCSEIDLDGLSRKGSAVTKAPPPMLPPR